MAKRRGDREEVISRALFGTSLFYMMSTRMNFDDQRELRTAKFRAQKAHDAVEPTAELR